MSKILKYAYSASILTGTIIGAGMFALPFIFQEAGLWLGILYLAIFVFVFSLIHTMYADIMLRTERLPGFILYVKKYIGQWAILPAFLATVVGIIFSSAIYLLLAASFAKIILPNITEEVVVYSFWALGSLVIFLKAKRLATLEFLATGAIILIIGAIFINGLFYGDYSGKNLNLLPASLPLLFLPFGTVLFSLAGRSAIPSLLDDVKNRGIPNTEIKRVIFIGTATPCVLYLLFIIGILGLSQIVTSDAVTGISRGPSFLPAAIGVIGILSLFTTYIPLNLSVKKILESDFNISHIISSFVVVMFPILIYFIKIDFLELIKITGGILLAIESIFISLIWHKLNILRIPKMLLEGYGTRIAYFTASVFFVGMIYELLKNTYGLF